MRSLLFIALLSGALAAAEPADGSGANHITKIGSEELLAAVASLSDGAQTVAQVRANIADEPSGTVARLTERYAYPGVFPRNILCEELADWEAFFDTLGILRPGLLTSTLDRQRAGELSDAELVVGLRLARRIGGDIVDRLEEPDSGP